MTTSVVAEMPIQNDLLEETILTWLDDQMMVSLDALMDRLWQYSWNQIWSAVDRLARQKRIVLRRHGFTYTLFSLHYAA